MCLCPVPTRPALCHCNFMESPVSAGMMFYTSSGTSSGLSSFCSFLLAREFLACLGLCFCVFKLASVLLKRALSFSHEVPFCSICH